LVSVGFLFGSSFVREEFDRQVRASILRHPEVTREASLMQVRREATEKLYSVQRDDAMKKAQESVQQKAEEMLKKGPSAK
jgi:hypothetical protein